MKPSKTKLDFTSPALVAARKHVLNKTIIPTSMKKFIKIKDGVIYLKSTGKKSNIMDPKLKKFLIKCVKAEINKCEGHYNYQNVRSQFDDQWDIKNKKKYWKSQKTKAIKFLEQLEKIN